MLCVLNAFRVPTNVDFESEVVKTKVKEVIQELGKTPIVPDETQDLKNIDEISSSFDEQSQVYQVNVSVSSQSVVKTYNTLNIGVGELDLLTTITTTFQENVGVAITFKPAGKFQSLFDAFHYFRIQAKAYISFGQIAANVSCSLLSTFFRKVHFFL